jgi:hypothetical protein
MQRQSRQDMRDDDPFDGNRRHFRESGNRDLHVMVETRTRRQLAAELLKSGKECRALSLSNQQLASDNQKLTYKCKGLVAEAKEWHAKAEGSQTEAQTLKLELEKLEEKNLSDQAQDAKLKVGNARYIHIKQKYIVPYASSKKMKYQEANEATIKSVLGPLLHDALEADLLRTQVQILGDQLKSLQEQLLSNVKKTEAIPDDQFDSDFRALASSIKSLSRSIKISDRIDIRSIGEVQACTLISKVEPTQWLTKPRQKCMIEAFVWSVLYNEVFRSPCEYFIPVCLLFRRTRSLTLFKSTSLARPLIAFRKIT